MDELIISNDSLSRKAADCLKLMRSSDTLVRERALAELKTIPTESMIDVLLEARRQDRVELNRVTHMDRPIWLTVLLPILPLCVVLIVLSMSMTWGVLIGVAGLGAMLWWKWTDLSGMRQDEYRGRAIYDLLNNSNNPRSAVIHADIFRLSITKWPDRESFASAVERLIQLLPEITPEHTDSFDPLQRVFLRSCLYQISRIRSLNERYARLGTAMIQYITNVEGTQALRAVKAIASRRSSIPVEQRMIETARLSIPILQGLQQRGKLVETMLRPSSAPPMPDATLLRAVKEPDLPEEDAELLRAHNGEVK